MSKGFSDLRKLWHWERSDRYRLHLRSIANCFPADNYDLTGEYSRVAFIPSGNFFVGGTMTLPKLKITLNPFIVFSSGRRFNIVTGRDTNGDGLFTERPAFATEQTDPADLRHNAFRRFRSKPGARAGTDSTKLRNGSEFLFNQLRNQSIVRVRERSCPAAAAAPAAGAAPAPPQAGAARPG